ncbi:MAG: tetratricopeptide repeat protein, partial [Vitreimonas sp.]
MKNWLKLAAIAVLVVGVGAAALAMSGVWPRRSQADLEQARVHTARANAHLQSGDQDAALRSLDESIRLYPLADAQSMRASMRIGRNDFQGALRDVSAVIGRGGRTAQNYSLRCWLRVRLDALDRARADCDEALRLDPAHASAFGNRGLIGLKRRHYRDAWEDFNAALRVGGSDQWVAWRLFGRGIAAWGQGRVTQGRQDVELALRANPGVAAAFAQFGLGVELMRELDDAAYAAAMSPRSLLALEQYLYLYPSGAHVTEARAQ